MSTYCERTTAVDWRDVRVWQTYPGPTRRLVEIDVPTDGFQLPEDQIVVKILKYDRRRKRAVLLVMEPLP